MRFASLARAVTDLKGITHLYDGTMPLYGIANRDTRVGGDTEPHYSGLLAHARSRDLA